MGEKPKKFHISDDGKIFRINDDGSFTELGNANNLNNSNGDNKTVKSASENKQGNSSPSHIKKKSSNTSKYVFFATGLVILVGLIIWNIIRVNEIGEYQPYDIDNIGVDTTVWECEYIDSTQPADIYHSSSETYSIQRSTPRYKNYIEDSVAYIDDYYPEEVYDSVVYY